MTSRTVGADVTAYASDGLGRRVSTTTASGDVTSFGWDQVGRMTALTDTVTGSQTDYTYSAGLRIGAATTVGEDTATEAFTWDTLAGVPLLLSDATHEYIYGLGTAPVAQVDTTTGEVVFLHGDLIGSTRTATDASGTQVGSWDYSVFGETLTATGGAAGDGAGVTRFLFAGEYLDDTGLYYLRARFYDPVTASFLSVDPALSATGSPYAYASGNPLQLVDPLGLWSIKGAWDSATSAVSSAVSTTVDAAASAVSATGTWIADNKGVIIGAAAGIVVGGGCLVLTAGAGSVACAALGGAVGGMVTYAIDTPKECWTAGGFFVSGAVGGVFGGLTAGAGNALAPLASKAFTAAASRATPAIRNAINRTVTALKPRPSAKPSVKPRTADACSFAGPTAVVMADGSTKAIEDIEVGDEVLAEDPVTGERGAHRVSNVWVHDDVMVDFDVDGSVVTTTEDHPFWNVTDGAWEGPQDFDAGDTVLTADGNLLVTEGLVPDTWITGTAFNLTVEDLHTYFVVVADEGVLVHNTCGPGIDEFFESATTDLPGNNGLTAVGRSYQKHAPRGDFPPLTTASEMNAAGADVLMEVLTNPATVRTGLSRGGTSFVVPNGPRAVFNPNGSLQYIAGR
ncbi:RHS repeat-associated core domain-containing protein [Demequina sp.]|uniref:RHS repeat-associated core domain-containing protein n=1 Tax=Demequina sp. TaxID=2050685 RepID=UPI0025C288E6|nr:RHS repeat-associated core domain-containing protein [Demequina sp.]